MSLRVRTYLRRNLRWSALHFTLLDPENLKPRRAAAVARAAEDAGTHAVLVGGSTGVNTPELDRLVRAVKAAVGVPVILFPGGAGGVSREADAVLFMSLLNSTDPTFLRDEQLSAVDAIEAAGLETIPMGYVVVEPGGRVGQVGMARLVGRDDVQAAVRYGLLAKYFGMDYVYLEAGSGAPRHVPEPMVRAVKRRVGLPVIVGGGIRDAQAARALIEAGADVFVTGNLLEDAVDVHKALTAILRDSIDGLRRKIRRGH